MESRPMLAVASQTIWLGIALETNCHFRESFDPRGHRSESRWLCEPTLQDRTDGYCADVNAPSDGKSQYGPRGTDCHPHLQRGKHVGGLEAGPDRQVCPIQIVLDLQIFRKTRAEDNAR